MLYLLPGTALQEKPAKNSRCFHIEKGAEEFQEFVSHFATKSYIIISFCSQTPDYLSPILLIICLFCKIIPCLLTNFNRKLSKFCLFGFSYVNHCNYAKIFKASPVYAPLPTIVGGGVFKAFPLWGKPLNRSGGIAHRHSLFRSTATARGFLYKKSPTLSSGGFGA